jgi:hypothetical protein
MGDVTSAELQSRREKLAELRLDCGAHSSFKKGHCAMELVSWLAGRPFSDAPPCVSPVIRSFLIQLNDRLDDDRRQRLKPVLIKVLQTVGTAEQEQQRLYILANFATRVATPAAFRVIGVETWAVLLESLPEVVDLETKVQSEFFLYSATNAAYAATAATAATATNALAAAAANAAAATAADALAATAANALAAATAAAATAAAATAAAATAAAATAAAGGMLDYLLPYCLSAIERMCSIGR